MTVVVDLIEPSPGRSTRDSKATKLPSRLRRRPGARKLSPTPVRSGVGKLVCVTWRVTVAVVPLKLPRKISPLRSAWLVKRFAFDMKATTEPSPESDGFSLKGIWLPVGVVAVNWASVAGVGFLL